MLDMKGPLLAPAEGAKIYTGNNRGINLVGNEAIACLLITNGGGLPLLLMPSRKAIRWL